MSLYLLDSSALLAVLRHEAGHEKVESVLADCCMHIIHVSEVVRKLRSLGLEMQETESLISELQLPVLNELTWGEAMLAADYGELYRSLGLSLADRICLSLAKWREMDVITADRRWSQMPHQRKIVQIRK